MNTYGCSAVQQRMENTAKRETWESLRRWRRSGKAGRASWRAGPRPCPWSSWRLSSPEASSPRSEFDLHLEPLHSPLGTGRRRRRSELQKASAIPGSSEAPPPPRARRSSNNRTRALLIAVVSEFRPRSSFRVMTPWEAPAQLRSVVGLGGGKMGLKAWGPFQGFTFRVKFNRNPISINRTQPNPTEPNWIKDSIYFAGNSWFGKRVLKK